MSSFKTVALGFAVVLGSIAAAQAATPHKKPAHMARHSTGHAMSHSSTASTRGTPANADHSADALNAQSLTRAQGAQ